MEKGAEGEEIFWLLMLARPDEMREVQGGLNYCVRYDLTSCMLF